MRTLALGSTLTFTTTPRMLIIVRYLLNLILGAASILMSGILCSLVGMVVFNVLIVGYSFSHETLHGITSILKAGVGSSQVPRVMSVTNGKPINCQ